MDQKSSPNLEDYVTYSPYSTSSTDEVGRNGRTMGTSKLEQAYTEYWQKNGQRDGSHFLLQAPEIESRSRKFKLLLLLRRGKVDRQSSDNWDIFLKIIYMLASVYLVLDKIISKSLHSKDLMI